MASRSDLDAVIRSFQGDTLRAPDDPVVEELAALGIPATSEFGRFFSRYVAINLSSRVSYEELNDLCFPGPQIRETTEWLRDFDESHYADLVALTSFEGGGGYVYRVSTGEVLEHSWPDEIHRTWSSFEAFIQWYLQGPDLP